MQLTIVISTSIISTPSLVKQFLTPVSFVSNYAYVETSAIAPIIFGPWPKISFVIFNTAYLELGSIMEGEKKDKEMNNQTHLNTDINVFGKQLISALII